MQAQLDESGLKSQWSQGTKRGEFQTPGLQSRVCWFMEGDGTADVEFVRWFLLAKLSEF